MIVEKKGNLLFRNCASSDLRRSLLHSVQRKSGKDKPTSFPGSCLFLGTRLGVVASLFLRL